MRSLLEFAVWQHDQKLFATVPTDLIVRPHVAAQSGGGLTQNSIAGEVAVRIVNLFEMIYVEKNDANTSVVAMTACQFLFESRRNGGAVRQHRENVFISPLAQFF